MRPADGSGRDEILGGGSGGIYISDWSSDGTLIFETVDAITGVDIWALSPDRNKTPTALVKTPYDDYYGQLSPDGRYLTYHSNRSGQHEVYVRSFPEGEGEQQISFNGGQWPRWNPKGNELFYLEPNSNSMRTVQVETNSGFEKGSDRKLFVLPEGVEVSNRNWFKLYDVAADGQRFLMTRTINETSQTTSTITVVQNWAKEFEGRE